jgi:hypothetical protein
MKKDKGFTSDIRYLIFERQSLLCIYGHNVHRLVESLRQRGAFSAVSQHSR